MSLKIEKMDHNMAKLTIEVDPAGFEKGLQAARVEGTSVCAPLP